MCKTIVAVLVLIGVSALPAFGQPTWTKASPGGGGSFQAVDLAEDGKVLVGSDLSGAYLRSGTATWTRLGKSQGIDATAVVAVRWKPGPPSQDALIGTKNGLYRTTNGGTVWTRVSAYLPGFVSAIAWKGQTIYVAGAATSTALPLALYKSIDDGVSWNEIANHGIPSPDLTNIRRAVKLAVDASDNVWLLSGHDGYRAGKKELYRSTTGGSGMVRVHDPSLYPIDVAPHPTIANRVLMSTSNSSTSGGADGQGIVYSSTTAAPDPPVWAPATIQNATTGAIWWEGEDDAYLMNVYDNACASSGANERARAGKFHGSSGDWGAGSTWEKKDDGLGTLPNTSEWDAGWSDCKGARGRALRTVAKTLSAKGEYWVSAQFLWRYTSTPARYENAFASQLTSSPATWITKGIDNANPRVFTATGTGIGCYFAGYYDLGIWRTTSDGARWENVNPVQMPKWQGTGGDVTGIVSDGVVTCATMGPSNDVDASGHYRYRLWRSTDTGTTWTPQASGSGLPDSSFMSGLARDPSNGMLWVTANGQLYKSLNAGLSWSLVSGVGLPSDGLYVTQAKNGLVLVGGTHGLYRSTTPDFMFWTKVDGDAFDFRNDIGNDEVWTDPMNTTIHDALHKIRWPGIHQILFDPFIANRIWVVSYFRNATPPAGKRIGIWKSDNNGVTFAPVMEEVLRRGVALDLGGSRLHITSGPASTAGSNDAADMAAGQGKQTCVADGSGNFPPANCTTDAIHADYPFPFGGPIDIPECGKIFVGVPGHGFMRQDLSCGGGGGGCEEPPCEIETERPGGFGLKLTAEEAKAAEAKGLKLYDIAGRRVQVYRPGVYFDGITHRRVVIIQK
jgi:hypothetical protein